MADHTALPDGIFELNAGRLCLDLTNTVRARPITERVDLISTYEDLLSWGRQATILTPDEEAELGEAARQHPRVAAEALARVLSFREALYGLFSARAAGEPVEPADLRTVSKSIARAMARAELTPSPRGGFEWSWPGSGPGFDRLAWCVARSAAEVLTSERLTFVRECAGYDCGRLFIDRTKNRSRRWCDMSTCGNRAKGRRHYERQKPRKGAAQRTAG